MFYKILSRSNCEKYCKQNHTKSSIIISIRSSWDKVLPNIYCNDDNKVKDILFLSFDETEKEEDPNHCMKNSDAEKVTEFVNKYYDNIDTIIVHCDGGKSRSAGVAAGIMRAKEGTDKEIFLNKNKYPLITCYLRTLNSFGYLTNIIHDHI